jgi:hypothetical protein
MDLAMGAEMKRPFLALAALGFALSGCSNQYFERKDTVTFSAGDAVAWNNAQQIPNPTPRYAYNNNIRTPGETAARAGADYVSGRSKWYSDANSDAPELKMNSAGAFYPDAPGGGGAPKPAQ